MEVSKFMAKRFSSTEKWEDLWFSELSSTQKLVFLFLVDKCNNAGFFEFNSRLHSFTIGITEEQYKSSILALNKVLVYSKFKNKVWIKTFLFHQNNLPLNLENNAHKQIVNLIKGNLDNFDYDFNTLSPTNQLFNYKDYPAKSQFNKVDNSALSIEIPKLYDVLISEASWQESISRDHKIPIIDIIDWLKKFVFKLESDGESNKNINDAKRHFNNWLKIEINKIPQKKAIKNSFKKQ